MNNSTFSPTRRKSVFLIALFTVFSSLIFITPSCYVGSDGLPGLAYVAFEWEESKPEYIDCGTASVPPNFYYGTYYRINPGWYTAYYDGKVWNGSAWGTYAWEMDYEIWVNPGQRGGYGYNGKNGMNTYLNFVCSPYGPELFRHDDYLRKAPEKVVSKDTMVDGKMNQVLEFESGEYKIRVTYRSVEPRSHSDKGSFPLN